MITKEESRQLYADEIKSGCRKLCGEGNCIAHFDCGHKKSTLVHPARPLGKSTVCPLAKYNTQPVENVKPWYERQVSEYTVTEDEIFALCADCDNAEVTEDGDEYLLTRKEIRLCMDCPVKMVEECMQEMAAEAMMAERRKTWQKSRV